MLVNLVHHHNHISLLEIDELCSVLGRHANEQDFWVPYKPCCRFWHSAPLHPPHAVWWLFRFLLITRNLAPNVIELVQTLILWCLKRVEERRFSEVLDCTCCIKNVSNRKPLFYLVLSCQWPADLGKNVREEETLKL